MPISLSFYDRLRLFKSEGNNQCVHYLKSLLYVHQLPAKVPVVRLLLAMPTRASGFRDVDKITETRAGDII